MRFSSFLVGLCLASLGAGSGALSVGGGIGQALLLAAATFTLGQILYVGLIALMVRDEQRLDARSPADDAARGPTATASSAKRRVS